MLFKLRLVFDGGIGSEIDQKVGYEQPNLGSSYAKFCGEPEYKQEELEAFRIMLAGLNLREVVPQCLNEQTLQPLSRILSEALGLGVEIIDCLGDCL